MRRIFGAYTTVRIDSSSARGHVISYHPTGGRWRGARLPAAHYSTKLPAGIRRRIRLGHAGYAANKTSGRKRRPTYHASTSVGRARAAHYSPSRVIGVKSARPPHRSSGLNALESRRANMARARIAEAHSARTAKQIAADLRNLLQAHGTGKRHATGPHPSSAKSIAAARANLAKARAVERTRPRTAAQLAASRSSIKRAQAVARTLPKTAAQKAAARTNVAKARAVAATRPRSARQIAAARANLAKARAARSRG